MKVIGVRTEFATLTAQSPDDGNTIILQDSHTRQPIHVLKSHPEPVLSVVFSPYACSVATHSANTIILWDIGTGKEIQKLDKKTKKNEDLREVEDGPIPELNIFSPNGKMVAVAYPKDIIKVWDVEHGNELKSLGNFDRIGRRHHNSVGYSDPITSMVFSPDNQYVLSGNEDGTIKVWDISTGKMIRQMFERYSDIWSMAISPDKDGKVLVSGDDRGLIFWDFKTGQKLHTCSGFSVTYVEFVDNQTVASSSNGGSQRKWNIITGKEDIEQEEIS